MSEIKDGGPAFPPNGEWKDHQGMSLRDYFAARAMQSLIAIMHANHASAGSNEGMASIADGAYGIADAMLRAREAKP